jgi:hypothetical protein
MTKLFRERYPSMTKLTNAYILLNLLLKIARDDIIGEQSIHGRFRSCALQE